MNAYELADILHQSDFLAMDFAEDAAIMLRQQADRIAELEKFIKAILKKGGCDGNICKRYDINPVKQLSKERIDELVYETNLIDDYPYDFVAAIIKEITE